MIKRRKEDFPEFIGETQECLSICWLQASLIRSVSHVVVQRKTAEISHARNRERHIVINC